MEEGRKVDLCELQEHCADAGHQSVPVICMQPLWGLLRSIQHLYSSVGQKPVDGLLTWKKVES
jgi:hypothetical protein